MMPLPPATSSIVLRPEGPAWAPRHGTLHGPAREARSALGLPTDQPVIMSGHQAELWHPGILSKLFAADAFARAVGGHASWVVVDQDANDPGQVHYPASAGGSLRRAAWRLSPPVADVPTGRRATLGSTPVPGDGALPCVREGLARIGQSLDSHRHEPTLARQLTAALSDASPLPLPAMTWVWAHSLSTTPRFGELLRRMQADPGACVRAYNDACLAHPRARLRPLRLDGGRCELPLWHVADGAARRPVYADELPGLHTSSLAPRALLMTGLLRLDACDLFIHGLGGERYDPATEDWFAAWLGPGHTLAPTVVTSATVLLPFDVQLPSVESIDRTRWIAHRASHDPGVLGDEAWDRRRRQAVDLVRAAPSRATRLAAYRAMRALTDEYRQDRAEALTQLRAQAAAAHAGRELAGVIQERAWPFPLYPAQLLEGVRAEIERNLGPGRR